MNADFHSDKPCALITGMTGFTGHYLAEALRRDGYQVVGTCHHDFLSTESGLFAVDLCNLEQVRQMVADVRPHVVAHLAAISFVAHGDVEAMYRVNILGTRNLLEALAGLQIQPHAVLLASSANIYGNAPVEVIDESVAPAPANDYAVSKLAMEYMARLWMERLPIIITRPFNYTGVGQAPQFLLPKIVNHFRRGERVIELGNIGVERDFSDVRTIAQVYATLLKQSPAGEMFNVCSGQVYALKEVLAMMAEIAGYEIEVRVNPAFVRANEVKRLQGDAGKLRRTIGDIRTIPLRETLRWMYEAPVS
ncbi:NAD-dependent epimerase/dehydratase [Desulfobulbus propionicus DSM 2032]|uniref:NAD-dependent epimerase/dehydratase n=1 Tax=Desulfobulbus propionicus (strain ATCC 33891 / DSM 2032 / VKM B-1956 / 1pr3) TaxID=577650 RepID=A0A7U4DN43_DESPD|nr:GDP-mannose 4,6-dehydratase [Desulfobulbus propionicus]ADW16711.1 NAD-dependent epimerase/dehydratase [Desulfobulbus propionicus DSM 2032]